MKIQATPISCGADYLYEIPYPNDIKHKLITKIRDLQYLAFVIFSDAVREGNGEALASYIKKHKLGTITVTKGRKNPNSGNTIKVWVWGPNIKALNKHCGYEAPKDDADYF